jgi:hypothetical protein
METYCNNLANCSSQHCGVDINNIKKHKDYSKCNKFKTFMKNKNTVKSCYNETIGDSYMCPIIDGERIKYPNCHKLKTGTINSNCYNKTCNSSQQGGNKNNNYSFVNNINRFDTKKPTNYVSDNPLPSHKTVTGYTSEFSSLSNQKDGSDTIKTNVVGYTPEWLNKSEFASVNFGVQTEMDFNNDYTHQFGSGNYSIATRETFGDDSGVEKHLRKNPSYPQELYHENYKNNNQMLTKNVNSKKELTMSQQQVETKKLDKLLNPANIDCGCPINCSCPSNQNCRCGNNCVCDNTLVSNNYKKKTSINTSLCNNNTILLNKIPFNEQRQYNEDGTIAPEPILNVGKPMIGKRAEISRRIDDTQVSHVLTEKNRLNFKNRNFNCRAPQWNKNCV